MKYLYLVITILLQCFFIGILGSNDNIIPVVVLCFSLFVVGLLLYKDGKKDKRINELGWGITYGSLALVGSAVVLGVVIYSVSINSKF